MTLEEALGRLDGVVPVGQQHGHWRARCPVHDDRRPSLDIRRGRKAAFIVYCRVCRAPFREILAALERGAR